MEDIATNLQRLRDRIADTCSRCGRSAGDVTLLAVSKTFPVETVARAVAAGQLDFGENRVQEAEGKILRLRPMPGLRWHLVGHLQSNKARLAAELFDCIHSVDSVRLAGRLDQACEALDKSISVLLQVDLGEEETKFGAARGEVRDIVAAVSGMRRLKLDGLMTIPPFFDEAEKVRPFFSELYRIRSTLEAEQPGCLGRGHLSMGMSQDFEVAIEEGATIIRIGTAIFGERSHA